MYEYNWLCGKVTILPELILPIFGYIGFMPVFSMLLNIFLCEKGIGDSLTETFLDQNSTTSFYQGKHKVFAAIAGVEAIIFVLIAIYCRPLWEHTQTSLQIKSKSSYLGV
jgi:hypothetical protein